MIKRLYVDNYRSLVNFECEFDPIQLLLGPNGGGKSTVFQILAQLRDFSILGTQTEAGFLGATATRWNSSAEQRFELDVAGPNGLYRYNLTMALDGKPAPRPRVLIEEVLFDSKPIFRFANGEVHLFNDKHEQKVTYPFDWHRSALATIMERPETTRLNFFRAWFANLLYFSPDPRQMSAVAEQETAGPTANLSNFADWYRHLRLEHSDHDLLRDLTDVLPNLRSIDLPDAGLGRRLLQFTFGVGDDQKGSYKVYFFELSEGQRILVSLYTILHFAMSQRTTVLIDEPDNFIALSEIQPWLDKVVEAVEDLDCQMILISHHPELLNRLAVDYGRVFDRPSGRHTRVRKYHDPDKTGLTPAETVARGWLDE